MTQPLTAEQKAARKLERQVNSNAGGRKNPGADTGKSGRNSEGNDGSREADNVGISGGGTDNVGQAAGESEQPGAADSGARGLDAGNGGGNSGGSDGNSGTVDSGNSGSKRSASSDKKDVTGTAGRVVNLTPRNVKPSLKNGKAASSKNKKADLTDSETLTTLIVSLSGSYAKMANKKHWEISEEEAVTIADPASIVLQSIPKKQIEKVNKLLAPISLIIAAGTVIAPRVMIDLAEMKKSKEAPRNVNQSKVGENQPGVSGSTTTESGHSKIGSNPSAGASVGINTDGEIARLINGMGQ